VTGGPVDALRADPGSTTIASDFDGTLAAIVDDPAAARPFGGVVDVLDALSRRYATVAVVSGRPLAFLEAHLPPAIDLVGLYGLEARVGGERSALAGVERWRDEVARVATLARAQLPPEVTVEPKGLSLTLHHRTHPELAGVVGDVAAALAGDSGLLLRPARMSVELHPPVAADKGTALAELLADRRAACFIGDDAGDLPAFDALDSFAAAGGSAVRVGVRSAEAPPGLLSRADLVVDGPEAVVELLGSL
jgi:trehalose 6-phosphate phosphatase